MRQRFDWQFGEETAPAGREGRPGRHRPWPRFWRRFGRRLLLGLLLSVAVGLVWGAARRQLAAVSATLEADLRASHALAWRAATGGDAELLSLVLPADDPDWSSTVGNLMAQKLWLDRPGLGLKATARPGSPPPPARLDLAPDLQSATVVYTVTYRTPPGHTPGVIALRRTDNYRREVDRWRLAPSPTAGWGDPLTFQGRHLILHYPERDAALSLRLAADLEAALAHICRRIACPARIQVDMTLLTAAATLQELAGPPARLRPDGQARLSAIGLVGEPVDEAAYQVLQRAYLAWALAGIMTALPADPALPAVDDALKQVGLPAWSEIAAARSSLVDSYVDWFEIVSRHDAGAFLRRAWIGGDQAHWRSRVASMINAADFYARSAYGFERRPGSGQLVAVWLDGGLGQGEIEVWLPYRLSQAQDEGQAVELAQTIFFRRDSTGRWRLAAPTAAFWGPEEVFTGERLRLHYPTRDEAGGLGARLDAYLDEFCHRLVAAACPETVVVVLETEPGFRRTATRFASRLGRAEPLRLPTPTLFGRPTDPAGQEALYRAYAMAVVGHTLSDVLRRQRTDFAYLHGLYLDAQVELGFLAWEPGLSVEAGRETTVDPTPPPEPGFPSQAAQLLCYRPATGLTEIWHLDPGLRLHPAGEYDGLLAGAGQPPEGGAFVWLENRLVAGQLQSRLLLGAPGSDGWPAATAWQPRLLLPAETAGAWPAAGLPLIALGQRGQPAHSSLVDLATCDDGGCRSRDLAGYTLWSTDGRYTLVRALDAGPAAISLGDDAGRPQLPLNGAVSAAWLDGSRFAYLDAGRQRVSIARAPAATGEATLSLADLSRLMPPDVVSTGLRLDQFWPVPGRPEQLLVLLFGFQNSSDGGQIHASLMRYDAGHDVAELVLHLDRSATGPISLSPDGRWLSLVQRPIDGSAPSLWLQALEGGEARRYETAFARDSVYRWSADGAWLLFLDAGRLRLLHPQTGRQITLTPPWPSCHEALWARP